MRLALLLLIVATAAPASVRLRLDTSEWANAAYHLACLTGKLPCSEGLGGAGADVQQMDAFVSALDRVEAAVPKPRALSLVPNYPEHSPVHRRRVEVLATAIGAGSHDDCVRALKRTMSAEDSAIIAAAIEHLRRSLRPSWTGQAEPLQRRLLPQLTAEMRRAGVEQLARQMASFLEADLSGGGVAVHLVVAPSPTATSTGATAIGSHLFVAVTSSSDAREAVRVAVHELTHGLYGAAPLARQRDLIEQFAAVSDGQPFYALLNEALATAAQRIACEPLGVRDDDIDHPLLARLAKAVTPMLKRALHDGGNLFDGFAALYLRAGRQELGAAARDVRLLSGCVGSRVNRLKLSGASRVR